MGKNDGNRRKDTLIRRIKVRGERRRKTYITRRRSREERRKNKRRTREDIYKMKENDNKNE